VLGGSGFAKLRRVSVARLPWIVYSVSTENWDAPRLLIGRKPGDWFSFDAEDEQDLGVTYSDCNQCEPST
jgi:hypothetical protein